ncbi:THO complex subunit 1 [Vitis vinifera]|uniref:THO complex subunit 1 n=1 Tax=Vitis vinifera TaxID=29760 RepID=A0A438BNG0_VITVI|nr:THO complex subunit 1 [Vitis vinifera]
MLGQDLDWGCSGESKTYMLFGKFGPDGGYMFRDQSVNVVRAFLSLAGNASVLVYSSFFGGPGIVDIAWELLIIDFRTEHPLPIGCLWSEHFCNPASISLAPTKWQKFTSNLMVVLNTFEAQPLSDEEGNANNLEEEAATFSIKYLTSSKLMGLEVRNSEKC